MWNFWFLGFCWGEVDAAFTSVYRLAVGRFLIVLMYERHFTTLLGFCFRFDSHEVYSAINGTFFLNHDFDILMHHFVRSFKKK